MEKWKQTAQRGEEEKMRGRKEECRKGGEEEKFYAEIRSEIEG